MLKIKVLNVSKRELFKDVDKAVEFDQSQIFKKLYENEFGIARRRALRGPDRRLRVHQPSRRHRPAGQDVERGGGGVLPVHLRRVAASCSASTTGTELSKPRNLEKIFDTVEYTKWKSYRDIRGLAVRRAGDAARAVPAALRRRTPSRSRNSATRRSSSTRRAGQAGAARPFHLDERRLRAWGPG